MKFEQGQSVAWMVRVGSSSTEREGTVVFVGGEGRTDADLDAALRAAGWTGAIRAIRWRRHPGVVPDLVVRSDRDGRPAFFAPLPDEVIVDVQWGAAPASDETPPATGATPEPAAAPRPHFKPDELVGSAEPLCSVDFQRFGDLQRQFAEQQRASTTTRGFLERNLPGGQLGPRMPFHPLRLRPRAAAAAALARMTEGEADLPPAPPASTPVMPAEDALDAVTREATKEAVAREILRFLDGTARTRDDLFRQVRALFTDSDHRLRATFARALDRCINERRIVRSWVDEPVGPILGYIGVPKLSLSAAGDT